MSMSQILKTATLPATLEVLFPYPGAYRCVCLHCAGTHSENGEDDRRVIKKEEELGARGHTDHDSTGDEAGYMTFDCCPWHLPSFTELEG